MIEQLIAGLGWLARDYLKEHIPPKKPRNKIASNILFHLYRGAKLEQVSVISHRYCFDFSSYCDLRNYFLDDHQELQKIMDRYVRYGSAYLDIGANNGYTAFLASPQFCVIHAFEPEAKAFKRLKQMAKEQTNFVYVHNFGLSNKDQSVDLHLSSNDGANTVNTEFRDVFTNEYMATQRIELRRYDSLELTGPGMLTDIKFVLCKIDVEGHELEVLEGMGEKLHNIENFYIETSDFNYDALITFMGRNGYEEITRKPKPGFNRVVNLVFEREGL